MSDATTVSVDLDPQDSLRWLRDIMAQQRRVEEEQGVLRNLYKRARVAGENVTELKAAIRDGKRDGDEVRVALRHRLYYLGLRRIPIGAHDLFAGMTEVTSVRGEDPWDAEDRGYRAGCEGVDIADAPYPSGSELALAWLAGWHRGQAAIARQLGPDTEQVTATRTRRRRKQPPLPGTEEHQKRARRKPPLVLVVTPSPGA
jgi:ribosome modulation factor